VTAAWGIGLLAAAAVQGADALAFTSPRQLHRRRTHRLGSEAVLAGLTIARLYRTPGPWPTAQFLTHAFRPVLSAPPGSNKTAVVCHPDAR
jgi:hypothetical protein